MLSIMVPKMAAIQLTTLHLHRPITSNLYSPALLPFLIRCRSLARFKQLVLEACSLFPIHSQHSATTERRASATPRFLPSRPSRLSILQVNHYQSLEVLAILMIPVICQFLRLSHSPVLSHRPLTSTHLRLSCSALRRATETFSR